MDYDWLIETITNGAGYATECAYLGHKTTGFSSASSITHYNYDLEKAKELMAEAGYPNGEGFPVLKATITELRKNVVEVLQQCWGELGLTIEINVVESSVVWDEIRNGNFSIGIVFNNCMVDSTILQKALPVTSPAITTPNCRLCWPRQPRNWMLPSVRNCSIRSGPSSRTTFLPSGCTMRHPT